VGDGRVPKSREGGGEGVQESDQPNRDSSSDPESRAEGLKSNPPEGFGKLCPNVLVPPLHRVSLPEEDIERI